MLILQIAAGVLIALTVYELVKNSFKKAKGGLPGFYSDLVTVGIVAAGIGYLIWKTW